MSGVTAEIFYLPLFTIVSILISYLAVSIVLTKLSNTGVLNIKDHLNWVTFVSAAQSEGLFADTTLANKIVYVNLNQYTAGWESGFPFILFDPSLVTEGTSLTIYNSPTSPVGSTLRVLFTNLSPGVAPYTDAEPCGTKCACPTNSDYCLNICGGPCSTCQCTGICNPKINLQLSSTLGRGQGVTVVVQRRIPNINLSQVGTCFYVDLTPEELQPRDWVPVKYHAPDLVGTPTQILNCSGYNNFVANNTVKPIIIQPLGTSDPVNNLCFSYILNSNTTFIDNIPSAFNDHYFRHNGPFPTGTAKYDYQWQDCMAADCKCVSPQVGVWCETP
jgi:hypothetical protein